MYINCPVCGSKNQDNREICWKCSSNLFEENTAENNGGSLVKKDEPKVIENKEERLLLNDLIRGMNKEEVEQLMLHAYEFRRSIKNDDAEIVKARAKVFYIFIHNMEMKTGVRVFKDGADITGLMVTFSTILVQLLNQVVEARKPKHGSKSFGSILAPVNFEYGIREEETRNWFVMRGVMMITTTRLLIISRLPTEKPESTVKKTRRRKKQNSVRTAERLFQDILIHASAAEKNCDKNSNLRNS